MPNAVALVDALRAPDGTLNRDAIKRILPYGDAFLFVDAISHLTPDEVEGSYQIPIDAPYARSHFVHAPIMPGVLTGEGMAQAGSLLVRYRLDLGADTDILVGRVESAIFHGAAVPGDTLRYRVTLQHIAAYGARLAATAHVGDAKVCAATMVVITMPREKLQALVTRHAARTASPTT